MRGTSCVRGRNNIEKVVVIKCQNLVVSISSRPCGSRDRRCSGAVPDCFLSASDFLVCIAASAERDLLHPAHLYFGK